MADGIAPYMASSIRGHLGWQELTKFGKRLGEEPLSPEQLRIFLASCAVFFREIPGGILALALRITDDRMRHDPYGAARAGSNVLLAAVDEYGLGEGAGQARTHHELFLDMLHALGIDADELRDPAYCIPEAHDLAAATRYAYRIAPVPEAVGFHYASEISSDDEFNLCYDAMSRHADAYTTSGESARDLLAFYYVHTLVEPEHGASSRRALEIYFAEPGGETALIHGIYEFMGAYRLFWAGLNRALFG